MGFSISYGANAAEIQLLATPFKTNTQKGMMFADMEAAGAPSRWRVVAGCWHEPSDLARQPSPTGVTLVVGAEVIQSFSLPYRGGEAIRTSNNAGSATRAILVARSDTA
jgi:hypothetical protein